MKDIKEFLKYYLGGPCVNSWFPETHEMYNNDWKLKAIDLGNPKTYCLSNEEHDTWTGSVKPILRKLESMAEEELQEMMQHFSKIDLSKCAFEHSGTDEKWANAIENGQVVEVIDINLNDHMVMMMDEFGEVTITLPQSQTFHYLLSKGFDLFNLIENGLAINQSTLTPTP